MTESNMNKKSLIQEITENSLKDLIIFHQLNHENKFKPLQSYGFFLGGGLALLTGTEKLEVALFQKAIIQSSTIVIIVIVSILVIRQFVGIRIASNNIYVEYTNRLQYLINTEIKKGLGATHSEIESSFNWYFNTPNEKLEVLRKGSADNLEIQSIKWISVLFVFLTVIPLKIIFVDSHLFVNCPYFSSQTSIVICMIIAILLAIGYLFCINNLIKKWCLMLNSVQKNQTFSNLAFCHIKHFK